MEGHSGPVICLTVFNLLLYSGSQDGTARCWVREFGNCTRVYKGAKHAIICVKLHNGILFTASVDSFVRAYDAKSGALKKLFVGHESSIQCLAIVGELMYTGGADAKLNVWAVKDVDQDIEDLTVESAADSPANGTTGLDDNIDGPEGRDDGYDQPTPATLAQQRRLHDIEQRLSSYDDVDSNSRPSP
ncbi:WD repeat-containing protein 86 [Hyalella azteca]|uniref:WD repeat-containing protein 86 n=1 Tax=Hyalella azteca TaxID=294128 RepID=A0A8B7NXJ0_HYAAZ|nr:WD repeat-containing protein 86 [Hyalella azteca]